MAAENLPASQTSTAVSLFQKAHGRMTTIQRIDEQVTALQEQRRRLQEELRAVQGLINEEFERVVTGTPAESANRMLSHMVEQQRSDNGHAEHDTEIADSVA